MLSPNNAVVEAVNIFVARETILYLLCKPLEEDILKMLQNNLDIVPSVRKVVQDIDVISPSSDRKDSPMSIRLCQSFLVLLTEELRNWLPGELVGDVYLVRSCCIEGDLHM